MSEDSQTPVSQNGGPAVGKKPPSGPLPELEYREKGRKGQGSGGGQQSSDNNNSNSSSSKEQEYMETQPNGNSKRLSHSDSAENLLLKEDSSSSSCCSSSSSANCNGKNQKNVSAAAAAAAGNASPRGHGTANGSVPSSAQQPSASGKVDKKQRTGGKGASACHNKDTLDNCIPNNQLSKPEALLRYTPLNSFRHKDKSTPQFTAVLLMVLYLFKHLSLHNHLLCS